MENITCILPVAGIGKRLQPHTFTIPKVLLPVAGKPILGHLIEFIRSLGMRNIVFIVGHLGDKVIKYVEEFYPDINGVFVEQKEFLGLGYAVYLAREYVSGPVFINLGDTLIEANIADAMKADEDWVGVHEVADPRRFGVAITGPDGWIKRLVEKPEVPVSNLALCGIYYVRESRLLFECLGRMTKNGNTTRNEFQLTDALQMMVEQGHPIRALMVEKWFDCGKVETLLATNRYLLEKYAPKQYVIASSVVINPPVSIDESARLKNCVIGPYASIGKDVEMVNVIAQNCIINDHARVKNVVISDSVIGYSATLVGNLQRINLGDASQVNPVGEEDIFSI